MPPHFLHILQQLTMPLPIFRFLIPFPEKLIRYPVTLLKKCFSIGIKFLLLPFFLDPLLGPQNGIPDIFISGRLQNIVKASQLHSCPGINKICMGGQKDTFHLHTLILRPLQQGKSVFSRHFYIAKHNVHLIKQKNPLCFHRIVSLPNLVHSKIFPGYLRQNSLHHVYLIINHQYCHSFFPPL